MNRQHYQDLLELLKVIADDNRLHLLSKMSEREWTATELAEQLNIADSTTSYHLGKLHGVGLARLRMAGNFRHYSLNTKRVAQLKAYINDIDTPITASPSTASDQSWIEALDYDERDKKVLRDYTEGGKLVQLPVKEQKWLVVLRWLASQFAPDVRYTEKEVNAILTAFYDDYATLRRNLVEYGFMRRERGGGNYWLAPDDETRAS